ncbi:hypothetical protein FRC04_007096 [Tulasnella sp. 424]|nr:hypothetical protein FRC04_007096 [Tulasnella sp. 424]KAG8976880.1 hypothetical protein FRC05_002817 [Tulasnella sp. 425]
MRLGILGLIVFPYLAAATVPLYGQCGGLTYTGDTDCVAGAVCQYANDYYSQCVTGTASTTATTTTTSKTSTTTSKTSSTTTTSKATTTTTTTKSSTTTTKTTTSSGSSSTVPAGAITVGKNGEGKYTTITQALADTSSSIIYVYAGNYTEPVVISRSGITIYGQTSNKLSYSSNTVTISGNNYAGAAGSDDASGTVRIRATGVKLYNLNIENTFGKPIDQAQAIALSVYAGTFACYACQIRGYQDTLLAETGTQFYGKCLIQGSVDFIFGQTASIWITGGTINTVGSGSITASGRSSADSNYYVIDSTTVTGSGSVYLGRPWSDYARVIFQNSSLGSNIVAAGWSQWSSSTPNTDHVTFGEYNNSGSGAWNSARASFATKLSAGISITTVLGSTSWIDSAYL